MRETDPMACEQEVAMRRLALNALVALGAAVTLACSSPSLPSELRELDAAEARWAARPFQAYAIEMRVLCFCPPIANEWARVEVVNDSITRVVVVASGTEVSETERGVFQTVAGVFSMIRSAYQWSWVKQVVAEYDPQLGFPTYVSLVARDGISDAGSVHYLRNATALPGP